MDHVTNRRLLLLATSGLLFGASGTPVRGAGQHLNITSPVPLHAPWTAGRTFRLITYFGRGGHFDLNNAYYATDWKLKGAKANEDIGEPILAPWSGRVTLVEKRDRGVGSGGKTVFVQLDAAPTVVVQFLHLDAVTVDEGERVKAAEKVGTLGRTGLPKDVPAHLHFGVTSTIEGVIYSIKPGPLDGQAVVRHATITSQNNGRSSRSRSTER